MPDERLPTGQTVVLGLQHVVAMFGATVLAPILMGFDPNVAIFFSGVATLIFFVATGGRVPSYLGSSFAFIGPVLAATGATVGQPNPNIGLALGGIIAAGALYSADRRRRDGRRPPLGRAADAARRHRRDRRRDRARAGADRHRQRLGHRPDQSRRLRLRALDRAPHRRRGRRSSRSTRPACGGGCRSSSAAPIGYFAYLVLANVHGARQPDRFLQGRRRRPGSACRTSQSPSSTASAISLIAPVAIILVAENLGHIKAIGAMTGRNLDPLSRAAPSSATASPRWCRARSAAPASRPMPRTWASWR